MDSLIHAFGLDVKVVIVQIVNFTILAFALVWFLYTPILKVLREREETIAQGLADAEAAAKAKDSAEAERLTTLAAAEKDARDIVANGKKVSDEKMMTALAEADEKVASRIALAEVRGEEIIAEARKAAEVEVAKLAILDLEKKLMA